MSAFEQGAAGPIKDCSLPDIRTAGVSPEIQTLPTVVPPFVLQPGQVALSEWTYYKEQVGAESVKKAGYLWIDNATTQFQTDQNRRVTAKHLGYDWIAEIPIGLSETNYASIIQELRSKGVEFVAFQGDTSQAVRLGEAMREQGWYPKLFGLQSNTYGQKLLDGLAGKPKELIDIYRVAQPGALVEEIDSNPEMQLYAEWLQRVSPGAKPTGLGMYAWASMKFFVDAVKAVGPNLTRAALVEELRKVNDFTANGLIPPQDIAEQVATDCVIMLRVEGGKFVRAEPGNDYRCRPEPGYL
jgi:ABC-type branched-subunit amino acid transport system substrate-binding protein